MRNKIILRDDLEKSKLLSRNSATIYLQIMNSQMGGSLSWQSTEPYRVSGSELSPETDLISIY
ncbi:MAG: hypothetical protein CVV33_00960 [Methanomicrobiales archaeon HGW-Methanomicrobiales-4]|nr:MAG: hypothetical protein CVV33_00960 [Methanomicrobiales archaeon HGW-Methanomicrobiales-4]